jgi:hypothetical protein
MEPSMRKWFGAVALAVAMMGGAGAPAAVAASTEVTKAQAGQAVDLSVRSHYHYRPYYYHRHYAYRPYYPYYYGRPYYYSPGPFFPFLPFIHGWEEPWLW